MINNDFPFYNAKPIMITKNQWLFVLSMVALGTSTLLIPFTFFSGDYTQFIPAVLFFAIPLGALMQVTPQHYKAIFARVRFYDVLYMFGFALLNLLVSIGVSLLVTKLFGTNSNPAIAGLVDLTDFEKILFFLKTIPQLFGEEIFTILIFLALLSFASNKLNISRKKAILIAWLLSSILFALIHLPTYNWNFLQCILVIGSARMVLTLAYMFSKNIWVSTGTHIINDWVIFGIVILGAGVEKI